MFSLVSVCLLAGLLKNYLSNLFMEFYGMVEHNPGSKGLID